MIKPGALSAVLQQGGSPGVEKTADINLLTKSYIDVECSEEFVQEYQSNLSLLTKSYIHLDVNEEY